MKLLLTINESDVNPALGSINTSHYREREAARAVITDALGQVYLMNVGKHSYHKLPGGGVDKGEDIHQALSRELMEEIGCKAEIIAEVGSILEYRDYEKLKQISYCFLVQQVGDQKPSALEEGELAEGMHEVKAKSISDAIEILESDKPDNIEGKFIQKRDLTLLRTAQGLIK